MLTPEQIKKLEELGFSSGKFMGVSIRCKAYPFYSSITVMDDGHVLSTIHEPDRTHAKHDLEELRKVGIK